MTDTPASGRTWKVRSGDNLQAILNRAECGETIALEAGAVFTGNFTLPAKSCDNHHWIVIRTSAPDGVLPPKGGRITPCYAGVGSLPEAPAKIVEPMARTWAQTLTRWKGPSPAYVLARERPI